MEIGKSTASGPMPLFQEYHLLMALLVIRDRGPLGRKQLSRDVEIGEGSVRSILKRLIRANYITTERNGNVITAEGSRFMEELGLEVISVRGGDISLGDCDVAVLVPGAGERITDGFSQRDAAVRAGARGATTLVFQDGDLIFPMDGRHLNDDGILSQFRDAYERWPLKENDVIIIGTANDEKNATKGALAAALDIM